MHKYLKWILKCSTWVSVLALCFLLHLQHTASTVFAAAYPAPCLLTFHRRGWCQLHQPQREPWFQPTAQTHAPFLPGNGLWPVSYIHSPPGSMETYDSFFLQQIDWYHQHMCVFCLSTRRIGGEEREEEAAFHSSPQPLLRTETLSQEGVGGGTGWLVQTPMIHSNVPLFNCSSCLGIYTYAQSNKHIQIHTHTDTLTAQ